MTKGYVHSFESMGLLDGPGIRNVVFLQGCNLRCLYCHNPDTWVCSGGTEYTPQDLVDKIVRFKPYFDKSGGGVTFSGGEPLLQPNFLIETLKMLKGQDIHTTVDTAGVGVGNYEDILKYTDLVLLDIKHYDEQKYKEITGKDMDEFKRFLEALKNSTSRVWIRHVVVPGINDTEEDIDNLCEFIKDIPRVDKVDLLPYHVLGVNKYEVLGLKYRLQDLEPMSKETAERLKARLKSHIG